MNVLPRYRVVGNPRDPRSSATIQVEAYSWMAEGLDWITIGSVSEYLADPYWPFCVWAPDGHLVDRGPDLEGVVLRTVERWVHSTKAP